MRAARVDTNHAAIVEALRSAGWEVISTARMGGGFPDLLIYNRRSGYWLVEVKTRTGKVNREQAEFHRRFPVVVIRTIEEAANLS